MDPLLIKFVIFCRSSLQHALCPLSAHPIYQHDALQEDGGCRAMQAFHVSRPGWSAEGLYCHRLSVHTSHVVRQTSLSDDGG